MITKNNKTTNKSLLKRFIIGASKGVYTSTLPDKILIFNQKPLVRIFRVLGGLSYLILLGKNYIKVSLIIKEIAFFIALLFLIYHLILTFYRIKHISYLLKSDELDIRNSPLDKFASLASKAILCLKGACEAGQPIGLTLGLMLGSDEILKAAGRDALFAPLLGAGLNKIVPFSREVKLQDFVNKKFTELNNLSGNVKFSDETLTELKTIKASGGLSEFDYDELRKTFLDFKNASIDEQKSITQEIKDNVDAVYNGKDKNK